MDGIMVDVPCKIRPALGHQEGYTEKLCRKEATTTHPREDLAFVWDITCAGDPKPLSLA